MAEATYPDWGGENWANAGAATFTVLLATGADDPEAAVAAIALAGGRLARRIAWDGIADAVALQAGEAIVVLDAQGVSDEILAATLPQLDGLARGRDAAVIAAFGLDQIDIVAAGLIGCRAQLLCAPDTTDWIAALLVARGAGARSSVHDPLREGEAVRLARLNEEVARIADVLARLSRREGDAAEVLGNAVGDRRLGYGERPVEPAAISPERVRQTIRSRRLRDRFFGHGFFEDPAWDMMLDLYAAHLERAQVSVSSLCIAAAVAPTTALRWIGKLTDAGLFERHADPFDRRRAYMALSPQALGGMHGYFAAVRDGGLTPA